MKHMKEIRTRRVEIGVAPAGQTENRNFMIFIRFMTFMLFMHGGSRG